ncbi:MAG: transglycosylase SLT domain-containing protein [Pseudomonadales bacterium]|nr:transglycosylase SLT domain-containing protein [Pseudomonadales bacterium]MDP6470982.1 transglycosylase SLT domain-containing protein [Pseudomonadales bacterium]MDP6825833.1 transglycosylase SLT domain-containing protein [Pseudomonadales bacterium]MDP6970174.1 transglycosylase SLT domain-containing protein [Pseudomonadales bacterium]
MKTRTHNMARYVLLTIILLTTLPADAERHVDPLLLEKLAAVMAENSASSDRFEAEVWLKASEQRLLPFVNDGPERLRILEAAYRESHRQQLDPDLVMAVMEVESHFDRFAISKSGAQGLMQVMSFWRIEIGRPQDNLTDLETNIRYGTTILAHYLDLADGDLVDALGHYNGSRGKLKYPERVVKAWRSRWRSKTQRELPQLQASCSSYALKACRY